MDHPWRGLIDFLSGVGFVCWIVMLGYWIINRQYGEKPCKRQPKHKP